MSDIKPYPYFSAVFIPNVNISVCSSVAPTAAKKRKITQRLLTLSVEHQFVTPVTALLVESEDGPERLLADSPRDPRQGCCAGTGNNNTFCPCAPLWRPAITHTNIKIHWNYRGIIRMVRY